MAPITKEQKFKVLLTVSVWEAQDPKQKSKVAEIMLDQPFTLDKINAVGTSLQAGSWEALKKVMEEWSKEKEKGDTS